MAKHEDQSQPQRGSGRLLAVFGGLCLGLGALSGFLALRLRALESMGANDNLLLQNDAVRQAVVERIAGRSAGIWDSFSDADVGRVMQVGVKAVEYRGVVVSSNALGMRERAYTLPKPEDVLRVVLLGDSFVFGDGAAAQDRLGVFLERFLTRGAQGKERDRKLEVLHLGASSWNVVAACSYLRRQLSLLQPDLVLHILVFNDLEDTNGTRGFGEQAYFTPRFRQRADSMVLFDHPRRAMGVDSGNHSAEALDHESRARYEDAARHLVRLQTELERRGARYLVLLNMQFLQPLGERLLLGDIKPENRAYLPQAFATDERCISKKDRHWNRRGHEDVALFLYGLIEERGLLPQLDLEAWDPARAMFAQWNPAGQREAAREPGFPKSPLASAIDFSALTPDSAAQVHGGVDDEGNVSPYASLVLHNPRGSTLAIEGSCLERPEIDGAQVRIFLEGLEIGGFVLQAGQPIRESYELPTELRAREYLNLRFECDDYTYANWDLQTCVSFRLARTAIVP